MNRNADSQKNWQEKILHLLQQGKEWAVSNKKISIPAAAVILVILLACVSMLSGKKETPEDTVETAQTGTEFSSIPVPEVPLEENAVAAVNILMEKYYAALAEGDIDTLSGLTNHISDLDRIRIEKRSNYIERYDNIVCYTKVGLVEDSYLVYVYNEAKIKDIETPAPSLNTYAVYKNESGEYYIYEGDLDDNEENYFQELSGQDDVMNLCNIVQAKYNEAIEEDEQLKEFMGKFLEMIREEAAKALAEQQTEAQESEAQEEAETPEETPSEPQVKVTEVETTDTVNVRSSDSETADKIGKAEKGTRLPLLEKKENGWSKVEFEGKEAFIKSEYLADIVNLVEEETSGGTQESEETTQTESAAQTEGSQQSGGNALVGKDGKVTAKTTVNVRASANENGERLGVIYQGEKLELIMQQADGWCKVKYNGKTGYVKTEFVE